VLKMTSTYPKARRVMDGYKRYVIAQSKANLTRGRTSRGKKSSHKVSGKLYKSLKGFVSSKMNRDIKGKFTGGSAMPSVTFEMAHYGKFLDEGVRGSKSNYIVNAKSPNKFRNGKKTVPVGPIRKWLKKKGLSQGLAFVIARSIYEKGIKKTGFFEKPFNKRYKVTMRAYHNAIADDIQKNFANQITNRLARSRMVKILK